MHKIISPYPGTPFVDIPLYEIERDPSVRSVKIASIVDITVGKEHGEESQEERATVIGQNNGVENRHYSKESKLQV